MMKIPALYLILAAGTLPLSFLTGTGCTRQSSAVEADAATAANWLTDANAALAQAKAEGKFVLMDFTGSDWCPPCQALEREVFSKAAFKDYADKHLVLLKLDFPQRKQLPEAEIRQNFTLQDKYQIEGYPTIVVLDSEGQELGRLGYRPGGAAAWVESLRQITKTG